MGKNYFEMKKFFGERKRLFYPAYRFSCPINCLQYHRLNRKQYCDSLEVTQILSKS